MLAPAKEEVIFDRPRLIMYREMISDVEMKYLKDMATPKVYDNLGVKISTRYFV